MRFLKPRGREKKKGQEAAYIFVSLFLHFLVVVEHAYAERVFRKENYKALRRAHEKTDRTIGNLLNKLVVDYLQDLVTKEEKAALRSPLRRERF
jgi:hypothetical protein